VPIDALVDNTAPSKMHLIFDTEDGSARDYTPLIRSRHMALYKCVLIDDWHGGAFSEERNHTSTQ